MSIKDLNLTEEDFKKLVSGLDALCEKQLKGLDFVEGLAAMFSKNDPALQEKIAELKKKHNVVVKREEFIDGIKILQGKVLQLKNMAKQS